MSDIKWPTAEEMEYFHYFDRKAYYFWRKMRAAKPEDHKRLLEEYHQKCQEELEEHCRKHGIG